MHLLTLTGFLGSGKTTLLLRLGRHAVAAGARVAVVVNEIGEIGVDDQLIRHLGLNVWELASGCICCTLSAELGTTLETLERDFKPDLVLLEPSGAADPRGVTEVLPRCRVSFESVKTAVVVDPLRIDALFAVLEPLVTAQIRGADVIFVSKADVAREEEMAAARRVAREINPRARLRCGGGQGDLPRELRQELLPWLPA